MDEQGAGLSIGVLAERAGTTPGVLRTWEGRFGFPKGTRTPAGHRRFSADDVDRVREVLAAQASGVPLQLAIEAVLRRSEEAHGDSVHAALVDRFPDLRPSRLSRRALVAASSAIEDEGLARAERPLVLGAFQLGRHFEHVRGRWEEIARTAAWCAVVADFGDAGPGSSPHGPERAQLSDGSPMRREWAVVSISATHSAVLSAWEVPTAPGGPVRYESVLSTRRAVAVAAAGVLVAVARSGGVRPPEEVERLLAEPAGRIDGGGGADDRVWLRALAHLDAVR